MIFIDNLLEEDYIKMDEMNKILSKFFHVRENIINICSRIFRLDLCLVS